MFSSSLSLRRLLRPYNLTFINRRDDCAEPLFAMGTLGGCPRIEEPTAETLDLDRFPHDFR